jgi:hypothetical protein
LKSGGEGANFFAENVYFLMPKARAQFLPFPSFSAYLIWTGRKIYEILSEVKKII